MFGVIPNYPFKWHIFKYSSILSESNGMLTKVTSRVTLAHCIEMCIFSVHLYFSYIECIIANYIVMSLTPLRKIKCRFFSYTSII